MPAGYLFVLFLCPICWVTSAWHGPKVKRQLLRVARKIFSVTYHTRAMSRAGVTDLLGIGSEELREHFEAAEDPREHYEGAQELREPGDGAEELRDG